MINFIASHLHNVCLLCDSALTLETVLQRLESSRKLPKGTPVLLPVTQIHVLPVILHTYELLESVILMELKHDIGCEFGRRDAVNASHCLSFPFLSQALAAGKI